MLKTVRLDSHIYQVILLFSFLQATWLPLESYLYINCKGQLTHHNDDFLKLWSRRCLDHHHHHLPRSRTSVVKESVSCTTYFDTTCFTLESSCESYCNDNVEHRLTDVNCLPLLSELKTVCAYLIAPELNLAKPLSPAAYIDFPQQFWRLWPYSRRVPQHLF